MINYLFILWEQKTHIFHIVNSDREVQKSLYKDRMKTFLTNCNVIHKICPNFLPCENLFRYTLAIMVNLCQHIVGCGSSSYPGCRKFMSDLKDSHNSNILHKVINSEVKLLYTKFISHQVILYIYLFS